MASRSQGRQFAVQILYQQHLTGDDLDQVLDLFWRRQSDTPARIMEFVESLVRGVLEHVDELDLEISHYLRDWTLDRMVLLDRLILRLALYELDSAEEPMPFRVVIDEALNLVKAFSGEESVPFVNGILHAWVTQRQQAGP